MSDYPLSPEVAAEIEAKVTRPQPCDRHGEWWQGSTHKPAWTPRAFLIRGDRFLLNCRACGHQAEAPAQALVDDGKGDWPWSRFTGRWACPCGSRDIAIGLDLAKDRA